MGFPAGDRVRRDRGRDAGRLGVPAEAAAIKRGSPNGEIEEGFFRTVYEVTPDTEAWEAWKAEQVPEPNPTEPEQFATYNELASAIKSGVNNIL